MYSFGRGPRQVRSRVRASWRSNDSLTKSILQDVKPVRLLGRLVLETGTQAPSTANANVHLFGPQVDILGAKSEQLPPANSGPGGVWLHFWLHSHRVPGLGHPDALL
jgi:hypothetical protein